MSKAAKPNLASKKAKASEVARIASKITKEISSVRLEEYGRAFISPKEAGPIVFPSLSPSRAGAALFPLVVETTTPADFGIIVSPDFDRPLRLATGDTLVETTDVIHGRFTYGASSTIADLSYGAPLQTQSELIGGVPALPLSSSSGCNITANLVCSGVAAQADILIEGWNGAVWSTLGTAVGVSPSGGVSSVMVVWPNTLTHISFTVTNKKGVVIEVFDFSLVPSSGFATSAPPSNKTVLTTHFPDWNTVLNASTRASIMACDCLVTYEGSTLNNGGSIAVCNTDSELLITGSFYDTIASRPHDMYRGRLASEGETEGGGHWHYVPDDPLQLLLEDRDAYSTQRRQEPYGYFGVAGRAVGEVVRIECHFLVNFYSLDPSFQMSIQPPFRDFSSLLYALRAEVPLASSNDGHLNKIKAMMRGTGKKVARIANMVDSVLNDHSADIARALTLLSSLA